MADEERGTTTELFRSNDLLVKRVGGYSPDACVVTFASFTDHRTLDRAGFGEHFLRTREIDAIHVLSRENDWYQYPETPDAMAAIHAATRGPIALLKNGDRIRLDAVAGTMEVLLSDEELATRRAAWHPRPTDYNSGAIWKYAQTVGPAHLGAVTHPGGAAETHCYADI